MLTANIFQPVYVVPTLLVRPLMAIFLTSVLVAILIMLPTLGIGDMNNLYKWLCEP